MSGHEHAWRMVTHVDGCHFYATTAACNCGATLHQSGERDPSDDPYAVVWFDEECARCRELSAGATPHPFTNDVMPAP